MGRLARLTWQSGTGKPAAAAPDHLPNGPPRSLLARILGLSIIEVWIFSAIGPRLVSGAYRLNSPSRRPLDGLPQPRYPWALASYRQRHRDRRCHAGHD